MPGVRMQSRVAGSGITSVDKWEDVQGNGDSSLLIPCLFTAAQKVATS